jgi:secretion/DNA translocation related TadE-like protein
VRILNRLRATSTRDRGYATVWVVTAMALVGFATAAAISVGISVIDRHRAAAAADSAALTIALHAIDGPRVACADGAALARSNGATVSSCELVGPFAQVVVAVGLPGPMARWGPAIGRARAGPVMSAPSSDLSQ